MRKIDTLKTAIFSALPELKRNPDRIRIWIERGTAESTQTDSPALASAFQLNVLVVEMASDINVLFFAIFGWLRVNQPDLMMPGKEGLSFDADILDNNTADVLIQLQLDQAVRLATGDDGKRTIVYVGEPDPPDAEAVSILYPEPAPHLSGFELTEDLPPWDD